MIESNLEIFQRLAEINFSTCLGKPLCIVRDFQTQVYIELQVLQCPQRACVVVQEQFWTFALCSVSSLNNRKLKLDKIDAYLQCIRICWNHSTGEIRWLSLACELGIVPWDAI